MQRYSVESLDPYDMEPSPDGMWVLFDDAVSAVEAAREEAIAEFLDEAADDDMPLADALRLARLWAAGKLIGGDAHAVSIALLKEIDRLSALDSNSR